MKDATIFTLLDWLDPRVSSARLAGMSDDAARAKGERFARAAQRLIDAGHVPAAPAIAAFVPGRIEVLGKHTDYCGGRSLLCTVERGMCFVAVANADARGQFFAVDRGESTAIQVEPDVVPLAGHWSNYPATVARRIARNFAGPLVGCDIAMSSDLPAASGLSSSSAMIVGTFLLLSHVNGLHKRAEYRANIRDPHDLAAYLGCHENGQSFGALAGDAGVGTFGGSQDHTAILCCRPRMLGVFSFCPVRHERDITMPDDLRFVVVDSGVAAEKTGAALDRYNAVSLRARRLVELWNEAAKTRAAVLNDIVAAGGTNTLCAILASKPGLDDEMKLTRRLEQFVAETNDLIPRAADALERGDLETFGRIVDESQGRAAEDLMNQVPQTIALQRALRDAGTIASSAFGAGFGGSVWALASVADAERVASSFPQAFVTRPGIAALFL